MSSNIIGIDISKATLDIFDLNGQNHQSLPNSHQGIRKLCDYLCQLNSVQVIFEATGRYHSELERQLAKQSITFTKVNPWQARRFAEATGKRVKTDRVDARMLAQMGQALQLDPTIARDELIEILGEFELLRLALRFNRDLAVFYERLVAAGKPKKVAVTAVMRKLLITANALIRDNRKWQTKAA